MYDSIRITGYAAADHDVVLDQQGYNAVTVTHKGCVTRYFRPQFHKQLKNFESVINNMFIELATSCLFVAKQ